MKDVKRWKGLRALIGDAVEHGASAIERVQLETAKRPFTLLEQIPGLAEPVKSVHQIHDVVVTNAYEAVRLVNRAVGQALDAALDAVDEPVKEQPVAEPSEPHEPETSGDPNR